MKIWNVKSGPFEDEEGRIWNLCLVEADNGEIFDEEIYFESMNDAMIMVDHFLKKIDPITLEVYNENPPSYS